MDPPFLALAFNTSGSNVFASLVTLFLGDAVRSGPDSPKRLMTQKPQGVFAKISAFVFFVKKQWEIVKVENGFPVMSHKHVISLSTHFFYSVLI